MTDLEIKIVAKNIQGQLKRTSVSPLVISGAPGTGKSATIKALAKKLNLGLVEYSMPSISIEKFSGLPTEYATPEFDQSSIIPYSRSVHSTLWSIPEMMADCWNMSANGPVILLLDDMHAMNQHLQVYLYELLLERKMGNYRLPDNCAIIGTMNDSDKAGMKGMPSPIRNRLGILEVGFNFEHWLNSYGNTLHYMVASFLKAKPHYCQEPESTTIEGFATARAWTAIASELAMYEDEELPTIASRVAGMQVSKDAARAFHTHVLYVQSIDFTKLVAKRTLVDLSKQDPIDSIIYAYITNFIHTVDDGLYLFDLMNANLSKTTSAFIGFTLGELYIKNQHSVELTDGLKFVIARLVKQPINTVDYPNTDKAKLIKAADENIENIEAFMQLAGEYIL